jgi:hypothetical protein
VKSGLETAVVALLVTVISDLTGFGGKVHEPQTPPVRYEQPEKPAARSEQPLRRKQQRAPNVARHTAADDTSRPFTVGQSTVGGPDAVGGIGTGPIGSGPIGG